MVPLCGCFRFALAGCGLRVWFVCCVLFDFFLMVRVFVGCLSLCLLFVSLMVPIGVALGVSLFGVKVVVLQQTQVFTTSTAQHNKP